MKKLLAAFALVLTACNVGGIDSLRTNAPAMNAPAQQAQGTLIRVDFSTEAWRNDAWLLQVVSPDASIKRNVVVDPAGALIMVNYTMMCNFDGRGSGSECVHEAQRPAVQGRWYRFDMQQPAIEARWMGEKRYEILMPAGWWCPLCSRRGVEVMLMK